MTTLPMVELGVLGPLQVRQAGVPVVIPGAKPRAILTMLGLHSGSVVAADALVELLWGEAPPRTAAKALQTHISSLRRTLGDGVVVTEGAGWTLADTEVDAARYKLAARMGRDAMVAGDTSQATARFEEALSLWRGIPELPDGQRGLSEKTRWIESHAALVEDRADAMLATGRAAEVIGDLEAAVAEAPLRERRWGQLMLALYRAGRQGEALGAYQRARALLVDQLGVDPGPELRRLEAAIVAQDTSLDLPVAQEFSAVTRAVTFLLTDIEGSTAAWEADADAMAAALARHDELVEQVVTSRGGRLIKTRGEGDATFSVFERPSAAAAAAIELQDAITHEPWALAEPMRIRVALHTGEVELRDGDYFGRAVNRAARLRSLAEGGQILCSGATAELVIDSLADDVVLTDRGMRQLRNLARAEHVFELRLDVADDGVEPTIVAPIERPGLPAVLTGPGPFVGRGHELDRLLSTWQSALADGVCAMLIAGEPGVGKTRLAGEWSQRAYEQGAVVLYGRCDEDLGAPYQPFAEALRALVPCLGSDRLRGLRGVEALLALVPALTDVVPDLAAPTRADPDTERYALFDAVVAVLEVASAAVPVVLILDDLHWAAKPTLLLLRHVLRFGEHARVQIVGTYRSTDLDRSHPLSAMLADPHHSGTANRVQLGGLDADDVTAYVAEAGYDDEELARALATVTGGNPFFLIEALRHVDENGGAWDRNTLPQGVRDAVSRRLSRLSAETNKALAAAAVVGSRFAVDLVEQVVGDELIDALDEASKAGIVIEEPGGYYRFNHALVRQSLLAELASMRRMRLHQRIATTLEAQPGADDELLADLAHHYFECAWAGNAAKAVEYCRRAADQAMARLAYEGAADLYDHAVHALEELDDELPDRDELAAELLVARCEALLAAGDVASAPGAVSQLRNATTNSARLAAWATSFDGELSMLIHPERLDEVEAALGEAAETLAGLDDAAGQAKAHTVRAACLHRLGRIADCEVALDDALTAARRAREHRRVNAVLAGAPLAALWGPNPVPRAGGRCLDVVRLLRITTDSPAVEATSTRCQAVLEAFRGRAEAARRMIDSARRTVTELGLRHALLEVEQFAGIVELVVDDPAAAEPHLRQAYNGFRRMGLDADTAEAAALLGCACLALDQDAEADELSKESVRLAGNALKASIAWRTLRAQLLSRRGDHEEARHLAEAAVALAERTDALVDHGDACLTLAKVLGAAGNTVAARAAAERAVGLYERKGAAALVEKARRVLGERVAPPPAPPEAPAAELNNACVRAIRCCEVALNREAWDEVEELFAPDAVVESHRKIVGFTQIDLASDNWARGIRRLLEAGGMRLNHVAVIAVRGERLAVARLKLGTADVSPGAPVDEFLLLFGIGEDGRIALQVSFDVDDIDAALAELDAQHARFEELHPKARRLENAASQVVERFVSRFTARDWAAVAEISADEIFVDDRRLVVGSGRLHGRDADIANIRATADTGVSSIASTVIATRGERLVLSRLRLSGRDKRPEAFYTEVLGIVEIDADNRVMARVVFDLEDFDAAIAELDARYLAGEAAPYSRTWTVVAGAYSALNRHELGPTTPDFVNIDHRRGAAYAPGDLISYIRAGWDLGQDINTRIEAVHRLDNFGAVVTHAAHGTSQQGFEAEWRGVQILTVEGDMVNRSELFDEADLDAALARFDQLSRPAPRLENAASQVAERYWKYFGTRDWDAMAKIMAEDFTHDDRRRVVGAGTQHGPQAAIANMQVLANIWITSATTTVIATRGKRLALMRIGLSSRDQGSEAFVTDVLSIAQINADERLVAGVSFDVDDLEAAITELDARYIAGEAAPYSHTWSVVASSYAAFNRHEVPATDWVTIDHRQGTPFEPNNMTPSIRTIWDLTPDLSIHIEAVHRLNNVGAVITHKGHGTSQEGFDAEWRAIDLLMVDGNRINRCEVFDEANLDAVIARFEQLSRPVTRLENAASQVIERFRACFACRDWDAVSGILADGVTTEDRRRVVNGGLREGRDAVIAEISALADVGTKSIASHIIAIRGERLVLTRTRSSGRDARPEAFHTEVLNIVEIDADDQITATVNFDLGDIDAAFEELDARYLAGEAAAHAHTWSVITRAISALNRREILPTTPDWVNIDHRRGPSFAPGELPALLASWNLTLDLRSSIEAVHRLNNLGAVVSCASHETSQEGLDAEWRTISVLTIERDRINRSEFFDEADLDIALARFEELSQPNRRLENAASRADQRAHASFAACDWDGVTEILADDFSSDDRRPVVNAGIGIGRDVAIANLQAMAELTFAMPCPVATRGGRLVLNRARWSWSDQRAEAFHSEALIVVEINADERIAAYVWFDANDIDAALEELDVRYLAGEAAPYSRTWSVVAESYAALNRRQPPLTAPDCVNVDHRRETAFGPDDLTTYIRAGRELDPGINTYVEEVHRLNSLGAVITYAAHETSQEGFDAEWRGIALLMVDGDKVNRCEVFDEADLDAALARFEELSQPARRLENAASRVYERLVGYFLTRDFDAATEIVALDYYSDDRRRVVSEGLQHGRDVAIANMRVAIGLGVESIRLDPIATRGERLVLTRGRWSGLDQRPDAFHIELLQIVEIDKDERLTAFVTFDVDDIDAGFQELDARYLAGEAAAHAHTWSVIAQGPASLNRREFPPTTPDWVNIDHRRGTSIAPGEMLALLDTAWNTTSDLSNFIEAVHRLNDLGAVFTHIAHETSQEGFHAEWRVISVTTLAGDLINRCEVYDEADIDAALAQFEQLSRPAPRLANAASQAYERIHEYLEARDWDALAELAAENISVDDRRRVVNAGIRNGRDAAIEDLQAAAEVGFTLKMPSVIATRGARLALIRVGGSGLDPEAIANTPHVVEIDSDGRIAAIVVFDLEDLDAAFAELDARYLAGEAAAHARTWSVMASTCAVFNQHELPATTPDSVCLDHRPILTVDAVDLPAYLRVIRDLTPDMRVDIEAVHRLGELGAVVTHAVKGTSPEGFNAEWRMIDVLTVDGDRLSRCEIFEEADLDAALARFEELSRPGRRLQNTASRLHDSFFAYFEARNWVAMAGIVGEDSFSDDRRRVVNAGLWRGRDVVIGELRRTAAFGVQIFTSDLIAARGQRLVLSRLRWSASGQGPEAFHTEALFITEIGADERIAAFIAFDPDDIDAAFAELDAHYLAGEAAAHAHTWSVIAQFCTAFNRHELPAGAADWVTIDHRPLVTIDESDVPATIRATWDLMPDLSIHIEAVHRLGSFGAVATYTAYGTSAEGVAAEWRIIQLLTVEGDQIKRCEVFDETDLDAALTRFDELQRPKPRLENAVTRVNDRFQRQYAARNWEAIADMLDDDFVQDDRRRVVGAGVRHGRDAQIADLRAIADVWVTNITPTVIATRGERLFLMRAGYSGGNDASEVSRTETFVVAEINAEERIVASISFDLNDLDAAFEELDARYMTGEAAAHAHTWSIVAQSYASLNRHELPPITSDWVNIDHRRLQRMEADDIGTYIRATWDVKPHAHVYIEAVHRLSDLAAVVTHAAHGISQEGFEAEWRAINISTVEGDRINRSELFDEDDLDAALARFDELSQLARQPENTATRVYKRTLTRFAARDLDAAAEMLADDYAKDDRRRVVNAGRYGRDVEVANMRASVHVGAENWTLDAVATRGERLVLVRARWSGLDERPDAYYTDVLEVVEIDEEERITAVVTFDPDDISNAFVELEQRYAAGEAARYADAWSVISGTYAAFNRHELSGRDFGIVDHRPGALFTSSNMSAYIGASRDLTPDLSMHIEAVHRLSSYAAVVTNRAHDTSAQGFDAEWRMIQVLTVEGKRVKRCELFDETALDVAVARFEEVNPEVSQLENAASQVAERYANCFSSRDWDAMAELLADDMVQEDRRRVVNAGIRRGRDVCLADNRTAVEVGTESMTLTVIATRGQRLALTRIRTSIRGLLPGDLGPEVLGIAEIDADNRIVAGLTFDLDDIDGAFEELDARYLAGEAAAHAHTWSVISRTYAKFNRHELPATTPDSVYIDHRPVVTVEVDDLAASLRAAWEVTPDVSICVEAVHRLSDLGAVVTQTLKGTSPEGFDAEWRMINISTVEGDLISRVEIFDETDLDAALARFDELSRPL